MLPDPGEIIIQEKVRSINWTDAERRPSVALGHADDGKVHNLRIKGTLETPNIDGPMRVYWIGPGDEEAVYVRSPPLDNVEQGIELLRMFIHDEQGLMTVVDDWEPAESFDDDG
jgi:hypothetical protein